VQGRILVVEDSDEVRELLVYLLESEGLSVSSCEDAEQAFTLIVRERPDVVFTDLMLGATSGLDLITRIRSDLAPPHPPIVACSGFVDFEREALHRGAEAFIPKPADPATIRRTVAAILARRAVADHDREEAAARARALRAKVVEAAVVAVHRLEAIENLPLRSHLTTEFLPRYFGFGEAFAAVIERDGLRVHSSSNEEIWKPGQAIDLALCRDILETRSALLVPDLQSLGIAAHRPSGEPLRFFTGVPLVSGSIGVGMICFVDPAPRSFGPEDYSVLETFGQRTSAVMSGRPSEIAPMWLTSGLMSRYGLGVLLASELSRTERKAQWLSLLVFAGRAPDVRVRERTLIAELDEHHFAALLARESESQAREALVDVLQAIARTGDFSGGGLVEIEGRAASLFDARSILFAAERLLDSALLSKPGTIERIVFRREPQAMTAAAEE
jgi:CheY-like chemotaxis protein